MIFLAAAMGGCLPDMGEEVIVDGAAITPPSGNSSPAISGAPGTSALMGNRYSFTPSASDPDGDNLVFDVQNKPAWAQFSVATGALTGTPQLGDIGSYSNIVISVSDGDLSNELPQFGVTVVQSADGSITLSWNAPTQNEDGSPLTDLAGYAFYYGTSPGSYSNQVEVTNPGMTTFIIDNLVPSTYYIVATAINVNGVESRFSNEAIEQVF
jgi:hypothetical protein